MKIKIIIVRTGEAPIETEIENDLASMQRIVNGYIEVVKLSPYDNALCVCNEEGLLLGLPPNRILKDPLGNAVATIFGDMFITYSEDSEFISLPDALIEKYMNMFSLD